ncbi:hypothetical protein CGCFRS4_v009545 [Colletotrichum fructicola]|nr:hypothetical protein CGCFRS4_v009545 [Colletotrichum fructicola]KAF4933215.1 hypothetical protein CGCF245_v009839 [Colletotrichum fructicola]
MDLEAEVKDIKSIQWLAKTCSNILEALLLKENAQAEETTSREGHWASRQYAEFNLWCVKVGVHGQGLRSIDIRLKDVPETCAIIRDLLSSLQIDLKNQAKSAAGWSGDLEIPDAGSTSEPDAADIWEELFPGLPRFDGSELTEEYCIRDDILYQFLATKLRSASDDSLEGSDAISESSQRNIESVSKTSRKAKRSTILESLALEDYEIYQREYSRIRGPGTYQWLLGTDAFKTWLSEPSQTFSCYGIPGSGKSSLASAVIDHVVDHVADDATTGIAYVYCNQDRTALGAGDDAYYLFLNILKQLAEQLALIIPELQFLYNTQDLSGVPESISEVCRTIEF